MNSLTLATDIRRSGEGRNAQVERRELSQDVNCRKTWTLARRGLNRPDALVS
jgi:hypothetical protein